MKGKIPMLKVQMSSFREEVAKKLEENNAFEALLVNKDGYITEGSRSNTILCKGEINYILLPKEMYY